MKSNFRTAKYKTDITERIDPQFFCPAYIEDPEINSAFRAFYSLSLVRTVINTIKFNFTLIRGRFKEKGF